MPWLKNGESDMVGNLETKLSENAKHRAVVSALTLRKVKALADAQFYEPPQVSSFPIGDMTIEAPIVHAGNM